MVFVQHGDVEDRESPFAAFVSQSLAFESDAAISLWLLFEIAVPKTNLFCTRRISES
jgi:hypothetical protein